MMRFVVPFVGAALVAASGASALESPKELADGVLSLNLPADAHTEEKFNEVYDHFMKHFDVDSYAKLVDKLEEGAASFLQSKAATAYQTVPGQPHCDKGVASPEMVRAFGNRVTAFPGGAVKRLFGFNLSKLTYELSQKANGPGAASGGMAGILAMQGLAMGAGMLQSVVAGAIHIIPPFLPPLFQPLTCVPMITGHNCLGAVLYPITVADFVIADVTDAALDGYIAGFPNTYSDKVGQTSDAQYKACFASAMSMKCSALFPRCSAPMSRNEPMPVGGRLPMCFGLCISTLVMCPGFWLTDIMGECSMIAAPPMCTIATFWNVWRLPPQYASFEDANPTPVQCPASLGAADASGDYGLYDGMSPVESPFAKATEGAVSVPGA